MAQIPTLRRSQAATGLRRENGTTTVTSGAGSPEAPSLQERLELIQWSLSRYDWLRASTSTRASVLLSANTALVAGTIVLTSSRLQTKAVAGPTRLVVELLAAVTIILSALSISLSVNAIASWRTVRSIHRMEIPSRFLFNWGDTLRAVDGCSKFTTMVMQLTYAEVLEHASAELWTSNLQHRRRHKFLRYGIHAFRLSVLCFLAVAALALFLGR